MGSQQLLDFWSGYLDILSIEFPGFLVSGVVCRLDGARYYF